MAIIAANKTYDIYLTGSPTNQLRFRILNADANFKVRLSMYYSTSQRIDLYLNNTFINATNAVDQNGKMVLKDPESNMASFMPHYSNKSGTNFFNKNDQRMYFVLDGVNYADLKIAPVLYVRFGVPAITPAEFFNTATLIGNFALLVGIDPSKIRKVNIIRSSSTSRKKRALSDSLVYVEFIMYQDPPTSLASSNETNKIQNEMNNINDIITNQFMTGQLEKKAQTILNVTLASVSIVAPVTNTTESNANNPVQLVKVAKIKVIQNADLCRSMLPCEIQPIIAVVDANVTILYSHINL